VPFVSDKGREAFRQFLTRPFPRVFALAFEWMTSVANGGFDPLARALLACRNAGVTCRPYAIDADVVWSGDAAAAAAYARIVPAGSTTNLNFAYAGQSRLQFAGLTAGLGQPSPNARLRVGSLSRWTSALSGGPSVCRL